MKTPAVIYNDHYFFKGGGEMGKLMRANDWSKTPVGHPDGWPQSLRVTVSIILNSKFPMFLWWGDDLTQFYNDAYRPSLGNEGKHPLALGQKGKDCWPEIWEIIFPLIKQVREQGEPTWSEDQLIPIYRNGNIENVYWTFGYSPVANDAGKTEGVLVVCTETTEKVMNQKALEESEIRFRSLAENSDMLISLADNDLNTTYFNKAWAEFTGRSVDDLLHFGWKDFMHPDDLDRFFNSYQKAFDKKESFESEFRMLHKSGKYRWLLAKIPARFNPDGSHAGYSSTCIDITETMEAELALRKSEEEIRSLVESAPFPIGVYKGREMRITLANQSIMDIWGKGNEVVGKLYRDILPELHNQQIFQQLDDVFMTGTAFHNKNQRIDLMVDGVNRIYYFNYSFTPLFDRNGSVYGVMNTAADVTDLNVTKQKVEQSERNFRNMVLQAPVAMCILLGEQHVIEVANDLMIEIWGKKKEDVINKPVFDALPDARGQGLEEIMSNVYHKGETFTAYDTPVILLRNGKEDTVYQDFVYEPYRDSDGTILGVLAISVDVTTQVIARKNIEEAQEKAKLAIDSAKLGVYETQYATNEVVSDERFKEIFGITGSTRDEFANVFHPDDMNIREKAHKQSLQTGQLLYEARIIRPDKSICWARLTGKVIYNSKGEAVRLIGVAQDITELVSAQKKIEESEKNLRNTILQAPVAMCLFRGPDHVVQLCNERMNELWGKNAKDVINKPVMEALPEIEGQGFDLLLDNVYTTGDAFIGEEIPVTLTRNGRSEDVFVNFVYEPYRASDGTISGILAVAVEVTAQVIARQKIEEVVAERTKELADANSDLQRSNSELAQFAYIASHDLQEPLRKISIFSEMLENSLGDKLDEQSRNYLNKINNSSLRMNRLIRDVLSYSELVKDNDAFEAVDLNAVIENTRHDYDLLLDQKGATLNYKDLPVIEAIPLQMSQLFGNLIGNALKFSKKDIAPVINITAKQTEPAEIKELALNPHGDYVTLRFTDNGIGFKKEHAEQIFSIFQRLHKKSEFEGTGIGLAMCKKIALNHHGNINATGSSEEGAVFNVVLPLKQSER